MLERHTAYKHNSQPVKITGTFNHSVISKSHKIRERQFGPLKTDCFDLQYLFWIFFKGKKEKGEKTILHQKIPLKGQSALDVH